MKNVRLLQTPPDATLDLGHFSRVFPSDAPDSRDTGTQIIGNTAWWGFYPYVARDSQGNWYLNTYRATAGQAPVIIKFNGAGTLPLDDDKIGEASNQYTYRYGIDINEQAGLVAYSHSGNGWVYFFGMSDGSFVGSFDAGSQGHELAFDIVGNLGTLDSTDEQVRFWSPGGNWVAITGSDGSFVLIIPEPAPWGLCPLGGLALALWRRRH